MVRGKGGARTRLGLGLGSGPVARARIRVKARARVRVRARARVRVRARARARARAGAGAGVSQGQLAGVAYRAWPLHVPAVSQVEEEPRRRRGVSARRLSPGRPLGVGVGVAWRRRGVVGVGQHGRGLGVEGVPVASRVAEALPRGVPERRRGAVEHLVRVRVRVRVRARVRVRVGVGVRVRVGVGVGVRAARRGRAPPRWAAIPSARRRGDSSSRGGHAYWEGRAT